MIRLAGDKFNSQLFDWSSRFSKLRQVQLPSDSTQMYHEHKLHFVVSVLVRDDDTFLI